MSIIERRTAFKDDLMEQRKSIDNLIENIQVLMDDDIRLKEEIREFDSLVKEYNERMKTSKPCEGDIELQNAHTKLEEIQNDIIKLKEAENDKKAFLAKAAIEFLKDDKALERKMILLNSQDLALKKHSQVLEDCEAKIATLERRNEINREKVRDSRSKLDPRVKEIEKRETALKNEGKRLMNMRELNTVTSKTIGARKAKIMADIRYIDDILQKREGALPYPIEFSMNLDNIFSIETLNELVLNDSYGKIVIFDIDGVLFPEDSKLIECEQKNAQYVSL